MSRPDQCPLCGSLNYTALNADGSVFNLIIQPGLWDKCRCDECQHEWPFRTVEIVEVKQ